MTAKKEIGTNPQINLYLIKPSNYDDDGYVVRYFRGVLPSNTLFCLAALTHEAQKDSALADVVIHSHLIDETVMRVRTHSICRSQRKGQKTIVCLVGVQSNQFPRAADLAREFRKAGLTVILGGFHVSGYLAMVHEIPPDIQELLDLGVTIVKGEVEETWSGILQDAVFDRLSPMYDSIPDKPDLDSCPIPVVEKKVLKRFVSTNFGTIDCGRGCPFNCSFCTIINVQGQKMRFRSPAGIASAIRDNYHKKKVTFYFFTDDNFARNKNWEKILDALIDLREREQIPVEFMMQVDVLSHKTRGFVEKAERAGCTQVFIGMESINDDNLKAAAKNQNKANNYRELILAYHNAGISTHAGYILGFPFDTPDSIRQDLERLMDEVQIDMASFFILTPLPGSRDHLELHQKKVPLDPDYNRYDSVHETMPFANFPIPGSLRACYDEAWKIFYSFENMRRVLMRASKQTYWNLFRNFIWYKSAAFIEKRHPMMSGFLRLKRRTGVRPGIAPLPRLAYYKMRYKELSHLLFESLHLMLEMQLLWLETHKKSIYEEKVLEELSRLRSAASIKGKLGELQLAYVRARRSLPQLRVPSRFRLFVKKWSPFSVSGGFYRSEEVLTFWRKCIQDLRQGRVIRVSPATLFSRIWLDLCLSFHFASAWRRQSALD